MESNLIEAVSVVAVLFALFWIVVGGLAAYLCWRIWKPLLKDLENKW